MSQASEQPDRSVRGFLIKQVINHCPFCSYEVHPQKPSFFRRVLPLQYGSPAPLTSAVIFLSSGYFLYTVLLFRGLNHMCWNRQIIKFLSSSYFLLFLYVLYDTDYNMESDICQEILKTEVSIILRQKSVINNVTSLIFKAIVIRVFSISFKADHKIKLSIIHRLHLNLLSL